MRLEATSDLWWKNAIVYCLDVETFADSNGDGCGDFPGLTERIDYLAGLGVTCLWLLPFQPSPRRDDGYDVSDYYGVDPRFGSLGDFVEFVRTAGDRGIKVIADLVINHTSDQHPWFQAARSGRDSPYHDYYVWAEEKPADDKAGIVFPDAETSTWQWDRSAKQYYLHHFYRFQPDLNITDPAVIAELHKVMGFWLQLGLAGFRLDAVPFFLGTDGVTGRVEENPHLHLQRMRAFLSRRRGDAVLLGEVNVEAKDLRTYFGDENGDELHMLFDFEGMQAIWLALVREDASPLVHALTRLPSVPQTNQYANFVRNHDELTLDKLTGSERAEVFAAFAPQESMRLYGRGIRRRLASMLDGDRRRIECVYSLVFSLPGTPVVFYGDEIGMGDDQSQAGRMAVRTPMQWSAAANGGFSTAVADRVVRPVIDVAGFGYRDCNVADQRPEAHSLLNWFERLVRRRRECPEIGWGSWSVVDSDQPGVLCHRCDWQESTIVAVHNLSARPATVRLGVVIGPHDEIEPLLGDRRYEPLRRADPLLRLEGYGYAWVRLRRPVPAVTPIPAEAQ